VYGRSGRWRGGLPESADLVGARAAGHHIADVITTSLDQLSGRQLTSADISSETLDAYGAAVVLALQTKRSTWTRWNIHDEAARQTRLLRLSSSQDRLDVLDAIADRAQEHPISLTVSDLIQAPASVSRRDGESVFTIHNGRIYTSPVVLGAEAVLLDLAQETTGPVIDRDQLKTITELSRDKAAVLERIVTNGQKVEALIDPAGTGKTSLLAALKDIWKSAYGSGSVVALAAARSEEATGPKRVSETKAKEQDSMPARHCAAPSTNPPSTTRRTWPPSFTPESNESSPEPNAD
jgi:hypothetical protein